MIPLKSWDCAISKNGLEVYFPYRIHGVIDVSSWHKQHDGRGGAVAAAAEGGGAEGVQLEYKLELKTIIN